jgi:hypothetical protein
MKKLLALGLTLIFLSGCRETKAPEKKSVVGFYFDTVVTLSAFVNDDTVLKQALDECARYDKLFSRTVEGSDIWRINEGRGPVQVSDETAEMQGRDLDQPGFGWRVRSDRGTGDKAMGFFRRNQSAPRRGRAQGSRGARGLYEA